MNQYYKQIERLLDLSFNTDAEYFESNSILLHIFAMLYEELNIHFNNNVKYSLAEEIRLYLDLNYQYNLKMSEIADKFGIHANYMTRLFHQKFDISPKEFEDMIEDYFEIEDSDRVRAESRGHSHMGMVYFYCLRCKK